MSKLRDPAGERARARAHARARARPGGGVLEEQQRLTRSSCTSCVSRGPEAAEARGAEEQQVDAIELQVVCISRGPEAAEARDAILLAQAGHR